MMLAQSYHTVQRKLAHSLTNPCNCVFSMYAVKSWNDRSDSQPSHFHSIRDFRKLIDHGVACLLRLAWFRQWDKKQYREAVLL